jgi:hypothetical protein
MAKTSSLSCGSIVVYLSTYGVFWRCDLYDAGDHGLLSIDLSAFSVLLVAVLYGARELR